MALHETTIDLGISGTYASLPVVIEYRHSPASKGSREAGTGLPQEPDSPAEFAFSVQLAGIEIGHLLSPDQQAAIERELEQAMEDARTEAEIDRWLEAV